MSIEDAIAIVQNLPIKDRIQAIELLLQSVKNDLAKIETSPEPPKTFQVRTFDLGEDVMPTREEMYFNREL